MHFIIFTLIFAMLIENTALGIGRTTELQNCCMDQCCRRCAEPYFSEFCFNGGRCYVEGPFAICKCRGGFTGHRCQDKNAEDERLNVTYIAFIAAVVLLLGLVISVVAYYYVRMRQFIRNLFP